MHTYRGRQVGRRGPEGQQTETEEAPAHCLNLHIKFNQTTMFRSLGPSSGYVTV